MNLIDCPSITRPPRHVRGAAGRSEMRWRSRIAVLGTWLVLVAHALPAMALDLAAIPEPLQSWIPWVLHDVRDRDCPYLFNAPARRCVWPGQLQVDVTAQGGQFTLEVDVFQTAGQTTWVPLPGRQGLWPLEVTTNGRPQVVVLHEGGPALGLAAGHHRLEGRFDWPTLPESLPVPVDYGLVTLRIDGKPSAIPNTPGQLWLKSGGASVPADQQTDRLDLQVFRNLTDEQPLQVITQLVLDVAGAQREVTLTGAQLPGTVPMTLESPLPTRLEPNGDLRVQVRPGHWTLRLTTRHLAPVTTLALPAQPAPWPAEEIWVFDARPALRLVELAGPVAIDPRQTQLPALWQALPAYRLIAGESLQLQVQRRGDPEPAPDQLGLKRQLWLDFDGRGMTAKDTISGLMTRAWRLEAGPGLELGSVALNGEAQFVTTLDGQQRGVEVRRGAVELSADSRLSGDLRTLPAAGWAQDVNSLAVTLNLPPGWRLWSAQGVDNLPDTWLHRWTLLDIFLVLIATVAVARLWHWRWGLLALVTLVSIWHEAAAPRQVWLHLLAAIALLSVLPSGRIRQLVSAYRNVGLLVLVASSVVFMVGHLRLGLYPQLEYPYQIATGNPQYAAAPAQEVAVQEGAVGDSAESSGAEMKVLEHAPMPASLAAMRRLSKSDAPSAHSDYDPGALVQTGPGLPSWRWTAVQLGWNGPVPQTQLLGLVLLSPTVNLCLALLRIVLLASLLALFLRAAFGRMAAAPSTAAKAAAKIAAMVMGIIVMTVVPVPTRADIPDPALREELRQRLLMAPECLPNCAEVPRARVELQADKLSIWLEVHATQAVGFPLPGRADQWLAQTVLIDGNPGTTLWRASDGVLWSVVPAGVHQLVLSGAVPARTSFEIPFQLIPQRATASASGWTVDGLRPDGSSESQLIFTRLASQTSQTGTEALEARSLPAFFAVERTLRLGLDWRVETRIRRLTPPGAAAALQVPVLAEEAVTTPDIRVAAGMVTANFTADQTEFAWESVLTRRASVTLTAPSTSEWMETWRADISPIWHAELAGIPVIHHQSDRGQWLPEWQPWPQESVTLSLTRPTGVPGQTLTIDRSRLQIAPGRRATDATLDVTLRSSQGAQHTLTLPAHAELQTLSINGTPQPIRQEGRNVTLPVSPGETQLTLHWRTDEALVTHFISPAFSLGTPSVNATLNVRLPEDRWTLAVGGPRLGPAVLFWGVLGVIMLVAFGLGRTRFTPLAAWQWALLGIGLSQTTIFNALLVVGWLFALAWRARLPANVTKTQFNLVQLGLAVLTLMALSMLFQAIQHGLLGTPNMQITGNGSSAYDFNWFQDRADDAYPVAWVWSVPLWFYRGLMLAWALWLAFALLGWLRWGWAAYSRDGVWRSVKIVGAREKSPEVVSTETTMRNP